MGRPLLDILFSGALGAVPGDADAAAPDADGGLTGTGTRRADRGGEPFVPEACKPTPKAGDDELGKICDLRRVAAWYGRLADAAEREGLSAGLEPPLSPITLRHWLASRRGQSNALVVPAARHLQQNEKIKAQLIRHRKIFLGIEETPSGSVGGAVARFRRPTDYGISGFPCEVELKVNTLVEVMSPFQLLMGGDAGAKDIFTAFGGFQLHSRAKVVLEVDGNIAGGKVTFLTYRAQIREEDDPATKNVREYGYDWNYDEYLTFPNPDYQSKSPDAVAPLKQRIRVYHTNAQRLETANLACPYDYESEWWDVPGFTGEERVRFN